MHSIEKNYAAPELPLDIENNKELKKSRITGK